MLFCRTILLTGGGGLLTLFMAIPLRVLTLISRRRVSLQSVGCLSICGRSKFRLRSLFLLGVFSATESQLKTTLFVSASCISGCGSSETMDHLLIHCDYFGMVWHRIYQWLGISFIAPESASDHLYHFGHLAGLPRLSHSFMTVIWMATVWVIWKEKNNRIFN
jgi:hypothetical protein